MNFTTELFQVHKYKSGHQLVQSNVKLDQVDQDIVDRLSDISGQIRPNETFNPYFTCYPLPSKKYFVVARTWQDIDALRAGCVITKSLIVEIDTWQKASSIDFYFNTLISEDRNIIGYMQQVIDWDSVLFTQTTPLNELVESIFLENRRPVLVYDCPEIERIKIVVNLYKTFWTEVRGNFAVCTFALSPRTLNGKQFDLNFSIGDLRSRFVEWSGRRIDGTRNNAERHRWTKGLVEKIFINTSSNFLDSETANFLNIVGLKTESDLRLGLLWNELYMKVAEKSPFALLGLLDIINSQQSSSLYLYNYIKDDIYSAILYASIVLDTGEAWKFYNAILLKHRKKLMDRKMLASVKLACEKLTLQDPTTALYFLNTVDSSEKITPAIIFASIGDAIVEEDSTFQELFNIIKYNQIFRLIASSKKFAKQVLEDKYIPYVIDLMPDFGEIESLKLKNKVVANLVVNIKYFNQLGVLNNLIDYATNSTYEIILKSIEKNTKWNIREFYILTINLSLKFKKIPILLDLLLKDIENFNVDPVLAEIALLTKEWFENILYSLSNFRDRKNDLLLRLIQSKKFNQDWLIPYIMEDKELLGFLLKSNSVDINRIKLLIIQCKYSLNHKVVALLSLGEKYINDQTVSIKDFVLLIIRNNDRIDKILLQQLLKMFNRINTDFVVLSVIKNKSNISIDKLKALISLMFNSGPNMIFSMTDQVDQISIIMNNLLKGKVDLKLALEWLGLFRNNKDNNKRLMSAGLLMNFSFNYAKFDATPLLVESFPIVHDELVKERASTSIFITLFDSNKPKYLRHDLVKKYLSSNWSKVGLLQVAIASKVSNQILSKVLETTGGKKYIHNIMDEIERKKISNASDEVKAIRKFTSSSKLKW